MVSRAWPPVILTLVGMSLVLLTSAFLSLPAQAVNPGVCQQVYGSLPASIPEWLQSPVGNADLSTANRYDYLSGRLLASGLVDGSTCSSRGLNPDGSANGCGLGASRTAMLAWQNRYDPTILAVSQSAGLPPKVLKAVIAVESQFWPGADWARIEIGLGQMTGPGADLVLRWRPGVYRGICSLTLGEQGCSTPYVFQDNEAQRMLRGQLLKSIDVTCPECKGGINPDKGQQAVSLLGEALTASCQQSAYMIRTATGSSPATLLSYEDFWRFVLSNYHTGAGCITQALRWTSSPTSWGAISANLSPGCASGAGYIRRIEEQIKP